MARNDGMKRKPPSDAFERYWPELRGRVQERWSLLTNDRLEDVDGRQRRLAEKLRDAYGISEAEANRQVDDFVETHWAALGAGNLAAGSVSAGASDGSNTTGTRSNDPATTRGAESAGRKTGEAGTRNP